MFPHLGFFFHAGSNFPHQQKAHSRPRPHTLWPGSSPPSPGLAPWANLGEKISRFVGWKICKNSVCCGMEGGFFGKNQMSLLDVCGKNRQKAWGFGIRNMMQHREGRKQRPTQKRREECPSWYHTQQHIICRYDKNWESYTKTTLANTVLAITLPHLSIACPKFSSFGGLLLHPLHRKSWSSATATWFEARQHWPNTPRSHRSVPKPPVGFGGVWWGFVIWH